MFISFGYLNKKSILIFALPIVMFTRFLLDDLTTKKQNEKQKNMFYSVFLRFLGKSLNVILWIIVERKTISNRNETKEAQSNENTISASIDQNTSEKLNKDDLKGKNCIDNIYESDICKKRKIEKKEKCKKICLLILVCILDFFAWSWIKTIMETKYFQKYSTGQLSLNLAIRLFAIGLFSYIIIKNSKMYSHHILSIIIILVAVIFVNVFSLKTENNEHYLEKVGLMISCQSLFSIMYVCSAKYLYITKGNVFKFLFIDGIIGMIISILLQVSTHFIDCELLKKFFYGNAPYCDINNKLKTIIEYFRFIELNDAMISILLVLLQFFETALLWSLIFYFSVNHFGAVCSINLIFICFIMIDKIETANLIVLILGIVIIVFMTFVYNEIVILRFCGLDKNTTIEISKRCLEDFKCDFGEDEDEISVKSNHNYVVMKEDIGINDENMKNCELSTFEL